MQLLYCFVVSLAGFRQHDMVSLTRYLEGLSHHPTLLRCTHCYHRKMQAGRSIAADANTST
jgi:hypothetical protein